MKTLVLLAIAFAGSLAQAADSGLNCNLTYSSSKPLSTYSAETSAWLVEGDELLGTAVTREGVDEYGVGLPANTIRIGRATVDGQKFWRVTILDSKKAVVGVFSFPWEAGLRTVLPVDAQAQESEDPPEFDTLEVTCAFTIFAG